MRSIHLVKPNFPRHIRPGSERGQGLIEYLIIVALMGIATIAIVRVMSQAVAARFASVTHALQGNSKNIKVRVDESQHRKRDLGDFMSGAGDKPKSENHQDETEK